jgi:hypothetical protein
LALLVRIQVVLAALACSVPPWKLKLVLVAAPPVRNGVVIRPFVLVADATLPICPRFVTLPVAAPPAPTV